MEGKVQRAVRKIKPAVPTNVYNNIYPTGSEPGKFYATAKVHKLKKGDTISELQLRPIISNIGTATYQLAKYVAKLLLPLSQSEYTVCSSDNFVNLIRNLEIPEDHACISFDVISLFSNVPLNYTIDLVIQRVYQNKEISTTVKQEDMRTLLELCTKQVHFTFQNTIYKQKDGVAMGSPLGPVMAGIFMTSLERSILPTLTEVMQPWHRYVDDTFTTIKKNSINVVIEKLNSFHPKIQFTYELEKDSRISFLDVQIIKNEDLTIDTTVYRKPTSWLSFTPTNWRIGTVKTLILRAYKICSTQHYRNEEIRHIKQVFINKLSYPRWIINKIVDQIDSGILSEKVDTSQTKVAMLKVPYKGKRGEKLIRSLKTILKMLPEDTTTRIVYSGRKLSSYFSLKDKTPFQHSHNVIYEIACPKVDCDAKYIGETGQRISERLKEHSNIKNSSHVVQHTLNSCHIPINSNDAKILARPNSNIKSRKIMEALYIKLHKPSINVQEASVPLKLF